MKKFYFIIFLFLFSVGLYFSIASVSTNMVQAQCHCCSGSGPNGECLNHEGCGAECCSWPWDLCPPPRPRCSAQKWVGWCDGGGGSPPCDPDNWTAITTCNATCPAGYQGVRTGTYREENDCGDRRTRNCSVCCGQVNNTAPPLVSPPDNSTVNTRTPTLSWNQPSDWGFTCPNNERYLLRISTPDAAGNCNAARPIVYQLNNIPRATTSLIVPVNTLQWNTTYCWWVYSINRATIISPLWKFTPRVNPYFITYDGDVYIKNGMPSGIQTAPQNNEILTGATALDTRIRNVRAALNTRTPYISSNLFVSDNLITTNRASETNSIADYNDDETATDYSLPYTTNSGGSTRTYGSNFYSYYLTKFTEEMSSNPDIISVNLNSNTFTNTTTSQITARRIFGITDVSEKRIILLRNNTTSNNFELKLRATLQPQRGFAYNQPNTLNLRTLFDWQTVVAAQRPANPVIDDAIYCDDQTIFLVPGNLLISTPIINRDRNSSCIFIVEGHVVIQLADKYTTNVNVYPADYRLVEAMFLANSISFRGKDDQGAVIVNGAVITNNTAGSNLNVFNYDPYRSNKFDVLSEFGERPQVMMVYDPRHVILWAEELKGDLSSSSIRESRFLRLIQEVDLEQ